MQTQNSLGWKTTQDGLKQYLIREVPAEQHQKIERFVSRLQTCRHKLIAVPELIRSSNGQMLLRERREVRSLRDFLATKPSTKTKLYLLRQLSHALETLHTLVGLAHGSLHENCISISEEGDLLLGGITYNTGNVQSDKTELHNLIKMVLHEDSEKQLIDKLNGLAPFRIRNQINQILQNESWETIVSDWKKAIKTPPPGVTPQKPPAEEAPKQVAKKETAREKQTEAVSSRPEYSPRGRTEQRQRRQRRTTRRTTRLHGKKGASEQPQNTAAENFELPKPQQLVYHQELDEDQKRKPDGGWRNPKIKSIPPEEEFDWQSNTEDLPQGLRGKPTSPGRRSISPDRRGGRDQRRELKNTGGWTTPRVQQIRNSIPPEDINDDWEQEKRSPRSSGIGPETILT